MIRRTSRRSPALLLVSVACLTAAGKAHGESLKTALELYRAEENTKAALELFGVLGHAADQNDRDQAELYLAETLRKLDLLVPALFYYNDLFRAGPGNRGYLDAVMGLLAVQRELSDPLWVPSLINEKFNPEPFGRLPPDGVAQVNYLVGELSFRQRKTQDARAFLEFVPPTSASYPKALYLLAVLAVRSGDLASARRQFEAAAAISESPGDPESARRRNLARLASARVAFGMGLFEEAARSYDSVTGELARTAAFERGWASLRLGKDKDALAAAQAAKLGQDRIAEAFVLEAITLFDNCMWPAAQQSARAFLDQYRDSITTLDAYMRQEHKPELLYLHAAGGGLGHYSSALARELHASGRFQNFRSIIIKMQVERWQVANTPVWKDSRFSADLGVILEKESQNGELAAGLVVKAFLMDRLGFLQQQQKMAVTIARESAAAEALEREHGIEPTQGSTLTPSCHADQATGIPDAHKASEVQRRANFVPELLSSVHQL